LSEHSFASAPAQGEKKKKKKRKKQIYCSMRTQI
jgi:hypothetical protein